jgi:hypothetical protein
MAAAENEGGGPHRLGLDRGARGPSTSTLQAHSTSYAEELRPLAAGSVG